MNGLIWALVLVIVIAAVLPRLMRPKDIPFSGAPRLGLLVWLVLTSSLVGTLLVAGITASAPLLTQVGGLNELIHRCPDFFASVLSHPPQLGLAVVGLGATLLIATRVVRTFLAEIRGLRDSARLQAILLLGARRNCNGYSIIEDARPAAWSSTAVGGSIVLTSAAIQVLDEQQLHAVLAHERAHLRGSHHYVLAFARAMSRALPLRITALAEDNLAALIEMRADDVAAKASDGPSVVASALLALSAGVPHGSLAAGAGQHALARLDRLLVPQTFPIWSRALLAASAVVLACAPLIFVVLGFQPVAWLHFCPLPR